MTLTAVTKKARETDTLTVTLGKDGFDCGSQDAEAIGRVYDFCSAHAETHSNDNRTWETCDKLTILKWDGTLFSNNGTRTSGDNKWIFTDADDDNSYLNLYSDAVDCGEYN